MLCECDRRADSGLCSLTRTTVITGEEGSLLCGLDPPDCRDRGANMLASVSSPPPLMAMEADSWCMGGRKRREIWSKSENIRVLCLVWYLSEELPDWRCIGDVMYAEGQSSARGGQTILLHSQNNCKDSRRFDDVKSA